MPSIIQREEQLGNYYLLKLTVFVFRHGFTRINTVFRKLDSSFRGNDKLGYLFVETSLISVHNLKSVSLSK